MKNILLSFLFLSLSAYGQWVELDTGIEASFFSDVYALSTDVAIVVGSNGTIIKTTDGGETWEQKDSGTTFGLAKVQFATPNIGYIIGGNGTLLKTTDAGESWISIGTGQTANFEGLSVVNENLIYISYYDNLIKTLDGGNTWSNYPMISFFNNYIQFFDNLTGYSAKGTGVIAKTTDGGQNWQELSGISTFYFINQNIGFYYDGGLYKTIDGGNSFELINFGSGEYLSTILAISENTIWGIFAGLLDGDGTTRGLIKITYSDTEPYTEDIWYDNNSEMNMSSIYFVDETTGYIVGFNQEKGAIWKNSTGINTMNTAENNYSDKVKVYPNPASSEINIILENSNEKNYTVFLTDLSGKQFYSKPYKDNQAKINTQGFPKGTYILSIKTKNQNFTKKIIIN